MITADMDSSGVISSDTSDHLPHKQLFASIDQKLESLIKNDPLLCHLPQDVTTGELEDLIGLHSGQKMAVWLQTEDSSLRVIVDNDANVRQLKRSIRKWFTFNYKRKITKNKVNINWKHVWRAYCLVFDGQTLTHDSMPIKSIGIANKSRISFCRKKFNK